MLRMLDKYNVLYLKLFCIITVITLVYDMLGNPVWEISRFISFLAFAGTMIWRLVDMKKGNYM